MIVQVTYFKPSGKFYISTAWEVRDGMLHHEVVAKLRSRATSGNQNDPLPGLCGDGWDGYVHMQIGNVPHILKLERSPEQHTENARL